MYIRAPRRIRLLALAGLLIAGVSLVPQRADAKLFSTDLWIVGGDLPHPVKIASEELQNPGSRSGESFEGYVYRPGVDLGPGYDILVGDDLAGVLGDMQSAQRAGLCCETYYPNGNGPSVLEYWEPLTDAYSARAEDRRAVNWEKASGGLYDLVERYAALAKAGLIGERPTFGEVVAASVRLLGAQASLDGTPRLNGTMLPEADAASLASALPSLAQTEIDLRGRAMTGPFYILGIIFGHYTGFGSGFLRYVYAPPGRLARAGLLFPQWGMEPMADPRAPSVRAYRTTPAIDTLVARWAAIGNPAGRAAASRKATRLQSTSAGRADATAPADLAVVMALAAGAATVLAWWRERRAIVRR